MTQSKESFLGYIRLWKHFLTFLWTQLIMLLLSSFFSYFHVAHFISSLLPATDLI